MANCDLKRLKESPILSEKRLKATETEAILVSREVLEEPSEKKKQLNVKVSSIDKEIPLNNPGELDFDFEKWFLNPVQPKPCYYFEKGLRKVKPYYYIYEANAKGRWFKKSILDIFVKEFQDQSPEYYKLAIETGKIRVNKKIVTTGYLIQNGDKIFHLIHRHEPPVSAQPITIISKSDDVIVVYKPSGMPVHPSGSCLSPAPAISYTATMLSFNIRYRYNTLLHILANEFDITKFYPANRLDRLTSGIILIAQSPQVACEFERLMQNGAISKSYYCRVNGEFPEGKIKCDEPIKTYSFKLGLNHVHPEGKLCSTNFERVSFNGTSSLVRCQPLTGRTHQIRVHLLHLGYPIANDPLYKLTDSKESFICELAKEKSQRSLEESCGGEGWIRCDKCQSYLPPDPSPKERLMWLHAFCYSGPDWSYTTKDLPDWAQESYKS